MVRHRGISESSSTMNSPALYHRTIMVGYILNSQNGDYDNLYSSSDEVKQCSGEQNLFFSAAEKKYNSLPNFTLAFPIGEKAAGGRKRVCNSDPQVSVFRSSTFTRKMSCGDNFTPKFSTDLHKVFRQHVTGTNNQGYMQFQDELIPCQQSENLMETEEGNKKGSLEHSTAFYNDAGNDDLFDYAEMSAACDENDTNDQTMLIDNAEDASQMVWQYPSEGMSLVSDRDHEKITWETSVMEDSRMTPLMNLRRYSFKKKQNKHLSAGDWCDNQYVRSCKDPEDNWQTTPLFHPFWFECMSLMSVKRNRNNEKPCDTSVVDLSFDQQSPRHSLDLQLRSPSPQYYTPGSFDIISIFKYFCSQNGSISKDHGHALKKFLLDMRIKNFDEIKLSTYRAAAKLFFVQKSTSLDLVDIYNIIEAFRENGLNTLEQGAEIDEPRLECIIASIYYSLYKRLPNTNNVDVERCITILTQWIMHAYDSEGVGRVRVLSVKTALSTLCEGRLVDKLRYVFTQISEKNGVLNVAKLDNYLRDLLTLPCAIGEEQNFGYNEDILESFFKPDGTLDRAHTRLDDFLDAFLNEKTNGVLYWLHMLNKICKTSEVYHLTQCKGCGKKDFAGLRYKCLHCNNFNYCQDCYWRERVSGGHKRDHNMKEFISWNKGDKGTSVKKKFLCSPTKSSNIPEYPHEPEPNKTLDMSNIVPALPCEPVSPMTSPNTTLQRTPRVLNTSAQSTSAHSTLSRGSSKLSAEAIQRQDDEHQLIRMYAQKLASQPPSTEKVAMETKHTTEEQKQIFANLEEKNRALLQMILQLKSEHEETMRNAQQMGCDPTLLTELRVLRQRKDELEMRMTALQETRRELMVQLEGLMKLLKSNQVNSPRSTPKSRDSSRVPLNATSNASKVKEAFDNSKEEGRVPESRGDLRADLLAAVEEVTGAMTNVVGALIQGENSSTSHNEDEVTSNVLVAVNSNQNTLSQVAVY